MLSMQPKMSYSGSIIGSVKSCFLVRYEKPDPFLLNFVNTNMKWIRLYTESDENQTIPISVSTRELKLIQNYMNHGKPLNDPSNRECMETVLRILQDLINNSTIENLDIKISNYLFENFGVELDVDPYGKNTSIPLSGNGLIEIKDCKNKMLSRNGEYADMVEGGFWDDETGELTNGFISVEALNEILKDKYIGNGVKSIQLMKDGEVAKLLLEFER